MASQYNAQTTSAYSFPLLIKGLLESGVTRAPEQEIVSSNHRLTYRQFAEQIEDLILRHPAVAEAAVIGVPDPKWMERPLGLLVAKPCQEVSEEQIRAHLQGFVEKGIITSYSVPDRFVFVEALPKTSVGKLDKKVLRERYAQ